MLVEADLLRLNVLLTQPLQAVRIDESRMHLDALTVNGEAHIELDKSARPDAYLREVRAWLSTKILGSPGGYPLYIRRWTRMGQARDGSLERLLLLGDPEATAAVVHAPTLTPELARRAWWVDPRADHARRMLENHEVAQSELGTVLVNFLLDYLPFEEQPRDIIETVRLIVPHSSLTQAQQEDLWQRAQRQSAYAVGFLAAGSEHLPALHPAHPQLDACRTCMGETSGQPQAEKLLHTLGASGQSFLAIAKLALRRPPNQDVVVALFNAIGTEFSLPDTRRDFRTLAELDGDIDAVPAQDPWEADSKIIELRRSMLRLARVGESLLDPIFGITDAVGSVMRRKIEPISQPLKECIDNLLASD